MKLTKSAWQKKRTFSEEIEWLTKNKFTMKQILYWHNYDKKHNLKHAGNTFIYDNQ